MKTQRVDLKPNRDLLDNDFAGYKLSLDPRPIHKIPINDVNVIKLNESQYSFQHVKSVSLHSHLHQDPWNLDNIYYVNSEWAVMEVSVSRDMICNPRKVYQIPHSTLPIAAQYNVTMQFISEDHVVLTDGAGTLYFLSAVHRVSGAIWKEIFSTHECASKSPFVLLHSIMRNSAIIDCLLLHIDERSSVEVLKDDDANLPFVTVLQWVTFTLGAVNLWKLTRTCHIAACGNIDYAAIEGNGQALCIVSEKRFRFISDSHKPLRLEGEMKIEPLSKEAVYAWTQAADEITLWLKFDDKTKKSDVEYKLTAYHLRIGLKSGQVLLEGSLFATVDVESSTWTWQNNQMEVSLSKTNSGLVWQELIKGDDHGREIMDANLVSTICEQLALLNSDYQISSQGQQVGPFNPQQLEECDDFPADSYKLIRINDEDHQVTHEVNLASHQWLFSRVKLPNEYPVFCIRHDVDGLLWQASSVVNSELNNCQWRCEHVATFNALGYVLASKQDKKFLSCSPENSFVAMCDARLYLYLYFQPSALECDLRNRTTGKQVKAVAKQQLFTLDTSDVLGLQVSNRNVFALTGESLFIVNVVD